MYEFVILVAPSRVICPKTHKITIKLTKIMRLTFALPILSSRTSHHFLTIFSTNINYHLQLQLPCTHPHSISSTTIMAASNDNATEFGFDRPEMYSLPVANSIEVYQRHIFLCYKEPSAWPFKVEDSVDDHLPYRLNSLLKARKDDLSLKTRLTMFGGGKGTKYTDGDVLIFPDMLKYKGLKESNVDSFVDDVLVNGKPWASGIPEPVVGTYVFVCAHASRDTRCGVCGPILIEKFKSEIASRNLSDQIFVNVSSHLGGHKYAGNIVIYCTNKEGKVSGDWYGYVTPADVPDFIDIHIGKGEVIKKLLRGQMGLNIEAAEKGVEIKSSTENTQQKSEEVQGNHSEVKENFTGCCQGANAISCCRINGEVGELIPKQTSDKSSKKCSFFSGWKGKCEQSDVLVAAGVIGAVATVAVAYSIFRRHS